MLPLGTIFPPVILDLSASIETICLHSFISYSIRLGLGRPIQGSRIFLISSRTDSNSEVKSPSSHCVCPKFVVVVDAFPPPSPSEFGRVIRVVDPPPAPELTVIR